MWNELPDEIVLHLKYYYVLVIPHVYHLPAYLHYFISDQLFMHPTWLKQLTLITLSFSVTDDNLAIYGYLRILFRFAISL